VEYLSYALLEGRKTFSWFIMSNLLSKSFGKKSSRNYVDLKRDAFRRDDDIDVETPRTGGEREMEVLGAGGRDTTQFFQEVGEIKAEMERIKEFLTKIQGMNEESKMLHQAQAMSALRDRMDADIAQVTKIARSLKAKLENLDRANAANRRMPGCEPGSTTDRTRTSITSTLRKKLKDLMGDFQLLRQRMMGDYRQTVERRFYTITGEHPDEETIESIIETGKSESFLQQAIQYQGLRQITETVQEIQERHNAMKDIEKNLLELHQIFMDMAVLVESQGEQLNDIEQQVNKADSFVQRGTGELRIAKQHQRSKRKWICFAVSLIIILLLIIILPILRSTGAI
jgi:syntaxin 1B/2/3